MEQNRIDPRHVEQARRARSPEELLQMAKREGIPLTPEEAAQVFTLLHPATGEVSDDELDAVSGGGCGQNRVPRCPKCHSTDVDIIENGDYHCRRCGYHAYIAIFLGF